MVSMVIECLHKNTYQADQIFGSLTQNILSSYGLVLIVVDFIT
jgi:hypothetical protein